MDMAAMVVGVLEAVVMAAVATALVIAEGGVTAAGRSVDGAKAAALFASSAYGACR
jgi:hypothetical protein